MKATQKQIIWAVLAQAISSITTFGFSLYLLRVLEVRDFGLYNIAFAALLFFASLLHGMFFVQMTIVAPTLPAPHQRNFIEKVELLMFLVFVIVFVCCMVVAFGIKITAPGSDIPQLILATIGMCIAFGLKEFHIRLALNERRGLDAVAIHGLLALALFSGVYSLHLGSHEIDVTMAILLNAATHLLGFLLGQVRSGLRLFGNSCYTLASTFKLVWFGGKWETITSVVMSIRNQTHTIVVGAIVGPVGVATLNASRLLVAPATISIPLLSQIMLSHLASAREQDGVTSIASTRRKFAVILGVIAIGYSALLLAAYPFVSDIVFGEKYQGAFWFTMLWCCFALLWIIRASYHSANQALRNFKSITAINTISSVVTLLMTYYLTKEFGLSGAILGVVLGELFVALALRSSMISALRIWS